MHLKLKRSQRDGGLMGGTVLFCLDARAELTALEAQNISRYKLGSLVLYNSEAQKALLDRSEAHAGGSLGSSMKSLAFAALAATKMRVTIGSLQNGQRFECKSMEELLGAEDAIMEACQNLKLFLERAATFDGQEVVIEFHTDGPQVVAHSASAGPVLAATSPIAIPAPEAPGFEGAVHREAYADSYQEYAPSGGYGASISDDPLFNIQEWWGQPGNRKMVWIGVGVLFLLYMMHSCHLI